MSPFAVFAVSLFIVFLLIALGMPIAFSFGIVGFVGSILIMGIGPGLSLIGSAPYFWASMASLIVVPLFILMGEFAFYSGVSADLFNTGHKWVGRLPGGLALATMLACTGFAACSGSSLAGAATMGTIAYPEMKRLNYSTRLATGTIAAGGSLGILIPPSFLFVIYGSLTETSIGKLFMAGILPGLMLSGLYLVLIYVMCKLNPTLGPPGPAYSWGERFKSLSGVWGMLLLFALVIGGLFAGVFAPSEAGALGAFGAFIIALVRRRLTRRDFFSALKGTARLTSMILTIAIGTMIFNYYLSVIGFTSMFGEWVGALPFSRYVILIGILVMYFILGMVMESLSIVFLTMPIVYPILMNLGFDPIWFGVILVIMTEAALITPPVGLLVYVLSGIVNEPLEEVFQGIWPFAGVMMLGVAILIIFPEIALYLPSKM